ncbi:hypothetical protein GCG54_00000942 [Colletotrichum gloeosporioides]|uniref:Uncharacterized protein n=1 Tax=Colletotrichum gloeosporioides TaxID=474922 RepID=A0A8H4FER8_COLGL|nr:uncharacterized protein GCG54_00000942 [Colletotrichum gloeosporioides]KAF3799697.1 hypothetical protein GCG54_00000942 [Colletotrichum gloeosporioides]
MAADQIRSTETIKILPTVLVIIDLDLKKVIHPAVREESVTMVGEISQEPTQTLSLVTTDMNTIQTTIRTL